MGWISTLGENIKKGIRSWLNVTPANPYSIQINEILDFEANAIRNRIWYRGDGNELEQLYQQNPEFADKYKFWACRSTPGMEMRKIHTGLPGLIVRVLSSIVMTDMGDFDFGENAQAQDLWKKIAKKKKFTKKLKRAIKETLCIGDGAFKISINTKISKYPIIEWFPGERIEIIRCCDEVREVIFKTQYKSKGKSYVLNERYGHGFIKNELYLNNELVNIEAVSALAGTADYEFDESIILAVPLQIYESTKYEGRGGSIFDGKLDAFDAFDEVWSQWMDALRAGRAKTYIPECLIPRNPATGEILKPNPFDNRYIKSDTNMAEGAKNAIDTEQPTIPHDSYLASYITALDLCLQGIISPSTLGIDTKKLDNADAQREKEKTTLHTRDAIIEALQETLPELVNAAINADHLLNKQAVEEIEVDIPFREYANPSFESQVETLAKARPGSPMMSIEAQVEELYGDTREEEWKKAEIQRLKEEQGIASVQEPGVNLTAGSFRVNLKGERADEGKGDEPHISDGASTVSGAAAGGE